MKKKEIFLNPIVKPMVLMSEPPVTECLDSITELTMDEANQHLSVADKRRWVKYKNKTANLYFINQNGYIEEVEPAGWWY